VQALHGLVSNAEWTGVLLSTLLEETGIDPKAKWLLAEGADAGALHRSAPVKDRNSYGHVRRVRSPKALRARSIALRSASGLMKKNPRLTAQKNDAPNSVQIHLPIGKVDLIPINPAVMEPPRNRQVR